MSIGPLGPIAPSLAATSQAQAKSDAETSQVVRDNQERRVAGDRQAEMAAGIGETDGENHQTEERDADGRRPWEIPPTRRKDSESEEHQPPPSDPRGELGRLLDLSG